MNMVAMTYLATRAFCVRIWRISPTHAGALGMHDLAWCNEAPVMHQDMVEGRFSHVPAKAAP